MELQAKEGMLKWRKGEPPYVLEKGGSMKDGKPKTVVLERSLDRRLNWFGRFLLKICSK